MADTSESNGGCFCDGVDVWLTSCVTGGQGESGWDWAVSSVSCVRLCGGYVQVMTVRGVAFSKSMDGFNCQAEDQSDR